MTLATRCSACGTVFRVVKDQLLVSDGWVRCGRCQDVFNALEGLFDLERDGPPQKPQAATSPAVQRVLEELSRHGPASTGSGFGALDGSPATAEAPAEPAVPDASSLAQAGGNSTGAIEIGPYGPPANETPSPIDQPLPSGAADSPAAAWTAPGGNSDDASVVLAPSLAAALESDAPAPAAVDTAPVITADGLPPRFVQAADRAAYWRRPGIRASLAAIALLLAAALAAQATWVWRDWIAARWPQTAPLLAQACAALGCSVQALAHIERLSVDGSALSRVEGTPYYKLGITLRNRGDLAVRAPAVELTLTDSAGSIIARRVLSLADFGTPVQRLDAGQELVLSATLTGSDRRVSGYTVELFYP